MLKRYAPLCREAGYPKLLTLTLRRGPDPAAMVSRVIDAFQKLRRRDCFEDQEGGAYFLEGKPPEHEGHGWNVHLHVLLDGPVIPQAILSRVWEEITGDSKIVDIRKVSKKGGLAYALGYCLEGSKVKAVWEDQPDEIRTTWEDAVKSRRLVQTFGTWHGATEDDSTGKECPVCQAVSWSVVEYLGLFGQYLAGQCGLSLWGVPGPPSGQQRLEMIV